MNESYHLYLTGSRARLRRVSGWPWRRYVAETGDWAWDAASGLACPEELPQSRFRQPLYVLAGSAFCRFLVVDLPASVRNAAEARIVGQSQMEAELGMEPGEWRYAVCARQDGQQAVACAVRETLYRQVEQFAQARNLRLASLRPLFETVWNEGLQKNAPDRTLIFIEDDAYAVSCMEAGRITSIGSFVHGGDREGARRAVRRQLIGSEVPDQGAIQVRQVAAADGILQADFRDLFRTVEEW
jgi:hypothetical protein